eukprot:TRINITY_DN27680_c0_g1_i1.p1 TRINITY_DN27680_c0_g1~~TRINITY_DN27680_c0_g1_i1.p1  ORF type:complete len:320 (-),score=78.67 TRINITY_DN27680_c0_g1_i1:410-1369(-)
MRDDEARTEAYYHSLDKLAPGRLVLDLGTGALALLAIRAARAGAKHVYAVEARNDIAAAARTRIAEAGLDDKITVLKGFSQDLVLPEKVKVDLVVHEILGEIASREGVAAILRDAAARHVSSSSLLAGGWSIPSTACTWIAPCEQPPPSYVQQLHERSGALLLAPPASNSAGTLLRFPEFPFGDCALAPPQLMEKLCFGAESEEKAKDLEIQSSDLEFSATKSGMVAGFAMYISIDCGAGAAEVSSANPGSHWANVFLSVANPTAIEVGDTIKVNVDVDLKPDSPIYRISATVHRKFKSDGMKEDSDNDIRLLQETVFK